MTRLELYYGLEKCAKWGKAGKVETHLVDVVEAKNVYVDLR